MPSLFVTIEVLQLKWKLSSSNAHTDMHNIANDAQTSANEMKNVRMH